MLTTRHLSAHERVCGASQAAFELAIDALHDSALQAALFERTQLKDEAKASALEAIRAAKAERCEDTLIEALHTTTDATLRNEAALALVDLRSQRGLMAVLDVLAEGSTKGQRATLLYAANRANATFPLALLVQMVIEDAEDAQYEAVLALEAGRYVHEGKAQLKRCLGQLEHAKEDMERRVRYVDDALKVVSQACAACKTSASEPQQRKCKRCA